MMTPHLWTKILDDNLTGKFGTPAVREAGIRQIVTSPIVVAPRPRFWEEDWNSFKTRQLSDLTLTGVKTPFDRFWIEGNFADDCGPFWGAIINSGSVEGGWGMRIECIHADPSAIPVYLGPALARLDHAGNLVQFGATRTDGKESEPGDAMPTLNVAFHARIALEAIALLGRPGVSLRDRPIEWSLARRAAKRFGGSAENYTYNVMIARQTDATQTEISVMPEREPAAC
jgi:hypothetical protein